MRRQFLYLIVASILHISHIQVNRCINAFLTKLDNVSVIFGQTKYRNYFSDTKIKRSFIFITHHAIVHLYRSIVFDICYFKHFNYAVAIYEVNICNFLIAYFIIIFLLIDITFWKSVYESYMYIYTNFKVPCLQLVNAII